MFFNNKDIAKKIYKQIKDHVKQAPVKLNIRVDSGYATITTASYKITVTEGAESVNYKAHIQDKSKIRNMAFEGFNKCLFAKQKFDSCTEKDLCEILESAPEVLKWFKINNDRAREIFDIKYQDVSTHEVKTYLPDFIVETTKAKYMIETKAEKDIDDKTVQAKKDAAVRWCEIATKFEEEHNGKPWYYLLIPDTMVVLNRTFDKLVVDCKEG